MTPKQAEELIFIIQEIVLSLYDQVGSDWCKRNMVRLDNILSELKLQSNETNG